MMFHIIQFLDKLASVKLELLKLTKFSLEFVKSTHADQCC